MRKIKFHAWDKKNKKMRIVTRITFGLPATGHPAILCHCDDGTENPVTLNCENGGEAILLQYTGIKDKNDKEIYAGDIYRYFLWNGQEEKGVVEWEIGFGGDAETWSGFGFPNDIYRYSDNEENWPEIEIIGNIYESDIEKLLKS